MKKSKTKIVTVKLDEKENKLYRLMAKRHYNENVSLLVRTAVDNHIKELKEKKKC